REVLPLDAGRPQEPDCRALEVGRLFTRHALGFESAGGPMSVLFRKLKWLLERRTKEAELEEELRFHLEEETEERRAIGLPDPDARSAAKRELGNLTQLREETRSAWGWTLIEQLAQDLRYAFRTMAGNKLFSALAILSLALGIGANTAIYSFMDSILMRSLPVSDPESLAVMNWHTKTRTRHSVKHGQSGRC